MTALTKDARGTDIATPSPSFNSRYSDPLIAGETIGKDDACYLKASDGRVWRATGAAADEKARIMGWNSKQAIAGEPVTLYDDVNLHYSTGMTPGTRFYLSGTTPGGLDTVQSTGGKVPCAFAVDANKIRVRATWQFEGIFTVA